MILSSYTTKILIPVDCSWNTWGQWSTCSVTCGTGSQGRTRTKAQQAANGGNQCRGSSRDTRNCKTQNCPGKILFPKPNIKYISQVKILIPVDCSWNTWGQWSKCSVTCGAGNQRRTRTKAQQATNGGNQCTGLPTDTRNCQGQSCPGETPFLKHNTQL